MLTQLRKQGHEAIPLLMASAFPGPALSSSCYAELKLRMLTALRSAAPFDGVLLSLHGSVATGDGGDVEGELLAEIRSLVGPEVPLVATLDLHAHVTKAMVLNSDALLAWETYPHQDAFRTGARAAQLLVRIVSGEVTPAMVMAKVPVIVSGLLGHTEGPGPFAEVMRFAKSHEGRGVILSTSVFLVHPYLDMFDMGGGGLVVTNGDAHAAERLAREIASNYWDSRFEFEPRLLKPKDAFAQGLRIEGGPVLLVDAADCCGGGAAGDSVSVLREMLACDLLDVPALVPVVDGEAAATCRMAGVGQTVELRLGHKIDPQWGEPLRVAGTVRAVKFATFRYVGGMWQGQEADMGLTAVLEIGRIRVLITSRAIYDWADEQFRCMGLNSDEAKFIVVKNPMNYRFAYSGISRGAILLDTPGSTPASVRHLRYKRLCRPYFPVDRDIPGLSPRIYRSRRSERRTTES